MKAKFIKKDKNYDSNPFIPENILCEKFIGREGKVVGSEIHHYDNNSKPVRIYLISFENISNILPEELKHINIIYGEFFGKELEFYID